MSVPEPQDAPPLRWGIIAPGGIAHKFADAVHDLTAGTVVAVGSRDAGRAEEFARRHGIPRPYAGYDQLVQDEEVEAVYVASPHSGHRDHALLAIEAGKHVLIEKALARNGAEVEEIFAAAQAKGVFAMEAMWTRHLPHIAWVREKIAAGAIGDIITVTADLGVYPVSFVVDLLGAPSEVKAVGRLTETGVDGHVTMVLGYEGRTIAQVDTTLWTKTPTTAVISGTEGSIEVDGDFYQPGLVRVRGTDKARSVVEEWDGSVVNGFQYEVAEVARCVADGKQESERMTWDSSRAVMTVMDEARRQVGVAYPGE